MTRGLRIVGTGWAFNLLLIVGCVFMPVALLACAIGALARILSVGHLRTADELIPGGPPDGALLGRICSSLVFLFSCGLMISTIIGSNYWGILMGLYVLALAAEGFLWMSWLSTCANRLECPIIGPVGNIARWCWLLLLPPAILIAAASAVPGFNLTLASIALFLVIFAVCACSAVTMLATNAFADLIPQLYLASELDESTLETVGSTSAPETAMPEETPLDIATGASQVIQVENTPRLIKPRMEPDPPRNDDDEPDTPMGVY